MTTQLNILQNRINEQETRIGKLEQETALSKEQRLQVIANTAVIAQQSSAISTLRLQVTTLTARVVTVEQLTDRLVDQQVTQSERIEQLETCATLNAETIGQVEQLKVAVVGMRVERLEALSADRQAAVLDFHERIEKLEAALRSMNAYQMNIAPA